MGVDARKVSSLNRPSERRDTIEAFRQGAFPVLVNCEVLTEGADIPEVSRHVWKPGLFGPDQSRSTALCWPDRPGARTSWPKWSAEDCAYRPTRARKTVTLSISSTISRGPMGCWSRPPCLGSRTSSAPSGISMTKWRKRGCLLVRSSLTLISCLVTDSTELDATEDVQDPKRVTFVDIDDPFRLDKRDRPIRTMSQLAWVRQRLLGSQPDGMD